MSESAASGGGTAVKLYVKANAKDGKGLGDCPISQRIMMILKLKKVSSIPKWVSLFGQDNQKFLCTRHNMRQIEF